jgi:hypothetical protein
VRIPGCSKHESGVNSDYHMKTLTKTSSRFKIAAWLVMVLAWLGQAIAARNPLDADAVSYLDISYSYLSGHWHSLINGYWSPVYPFLLALWVKIFKVGPLRESLAIHLLAAASLIAALISFEYFLSVLFVCRNKLAEENGEDLNALVSDDVIRFAGYLLFFWISTFLTPPYLEQPDILVFALYLVSAALSMQLVFTAKEWWRFALLGVVLGLGYLTKAVMFPLAFTFITTLLLRREWRRAIPGALLTLAFFAAVSAPFIFELSKSKGRLTYGDVGALAYRGIMGFDTDEEARRPQIPSSASAKPLAAPHVHEFTTTLFLGTYPPWADPSYGYHGAPFRFDLRRQLNRIHVVLRSYFDLYIEQLGALATGFLVLLIWGGSYWEFGRRLLPQTPLWLPAIAGLALYALVRTEGRMLAGFTIGLFAAASTALRLPAGDSTRRISRSMAIAVSIVLLSQIAIQIGHKGFGFSSSDNSSDWEVAKSLQQMGVQPGDRVSYLGDTLVNHAWAHLGRVRISAEIPEEDESSFWAAEQPERAAAIRWLAASGAKVLVTRNVPATAMSMGWIKIAGTQYYTLPLTGENAY